MFKDEFVFYASGILEGDTGSQLDSFNMALKDYGHDGDVCHTWMDAFAGLTDILTKCNNRNRIVVFIDELPCFDTYDSKFHPALDLF